MFMILNAIGTRYVLRQEIESAYGNLEHGVKCVKGSLEFPRNGSYMQIRAAQGCAVFI